MALVIAAGLATRAFPALMPGFLGKYPGDCLWAVMIFVGLGAVFPRLTTLSIAGLATGICFAVETLKLCPCDWLVTPRQTTFGHLVLGHAFTWQNYFAYAAGIALAGTIEAAFSRSGRG